MRSREIHETDFQNSTECMQYALELRVAILAKLNSVRLDSHNLLQALDKHAFLIAWHMSRMLMEITDDLFPDESISIPVKIGVLGACNPANLAFDDKTFTFEINVDIAYLDWVANEIDKDESYLGLSVLRFSLAHELYHIYTLKNFKTSLLRCGRANKSKNKSDYYLDRGERAANLYAIKHLDNHIELNLNQTVANRVYANYQRGELKRQIVTSTAQKRLTRLIRNKLPIIRLTDID